MFDEKYKKYIFFVLCAALLYQLLFSDSGVMGYVKLRREIAHIDQSLKKLEEENLQLAKEIDRLRKDDQYLEEYARKKFGLLREGEKLYRVEK